VPRPRLVGMKIGFKTSQTNVDWPTLAATWELADERPILDSGWLFDHFVALGEGGGGSHEAFTMRRSRHGPRVCSWAISCSPTRTGIRR